MKAYYLLVPLGLALGACTVTTPAPVAYVSPPSTVVMGAAPATVADPALIDSDGDGYANSVDRYPFDARYH